MKKWIITAGAVAGAIVAIWGAAAAFNFKLDRPAWESEVKEIGGESLKNRGWIFQQRQQYIDDRRDQFIENKKPVPKYLKERQRRLDRERRKYLPLNKTRRPAQ